MEIHKQKIKIFCIGEGKSVLVSTNDGVDISAWSFVFNFSEIEVVEIFGIGGFVLLSWLCRLVINKLFYSKIYKNIFHMSFSFFFFFFCKINIFINF